MTWSSQFEDMLRGGIFEPIIMLHVMKWAGTPGHEFWAASAPGYGVPEIVGPSLSMSGMSVSPVTWEYTHGTCSVELSTDDIGLLTANVPRGSLCQVLVGFAGWDIADFEPVFVGKVQNIRGRPPNYTLDLWDGTSVLNSRLNSGSFSAFTLNRNNLFYNVKSSQYTTLTTQYETSHNTLDVAAASKLEMPTSSTTYPGAVYIDNGTTQFFLTYTGKSGNQLTGVTTSNILGTTRAQSTTADSKVYNAAYLQGVPAEIFLRLLVSGSGSSVYDTYPETWGYGLPASLIDVTDVFNVYLAMVRAAGAGTYLLTYGQKDSIDDSWTWISEFFRDIGLVPVIRHGLITFRPIQDPAAPLIDTDISITDADIAEVLEWGAYHPDVPAEYLQVKVAADGGSTLTSLRDPETSPIAGRITYDNTDKIFTYGSNSNNEIKARVKMWGTNLPEYVSLRCAGMRLATLAPLDIVQVTSTMIGKGRIYATRDNGYDNQPCMVLSVSPDFYTGEVVLELAAIDSSLSGAGAVTWTSSEQG